MDKFVVREEHIKLLRAMFTDWDDCEFGAPKVCPKRPYGSSYLFRDVAEILEIEPCVETEWGGEFSREQVDHMYDLHRGTLTALQIALSTGSFAPGTYEFDCDNRWKRVGDHGKA